MAKVRNDNGVTVKQLGQMCFILIVILLALPKFLSTGVGEEVVEEIEKLEEKVGELEGVEAHTLPGTDKLGEEHRLRHILHIKEAKINMLQSQHSTLEQEFVKVKEQLVAMGLKAVEELGVLGMKYDNITKTQLGVFNKPLTTLGSHPGGLFANIPLHVDKYTAAEGYMFHDPSETIPEGEKCTILIESAGIEIKSGKSIYMVWDEPGISDTEDVNSIQTVSAVVGGSDPTDMELLVISTPAGKVVVEVEDARGLRELSRKVTAHHPGIKARPIAHVTKSYEYDPGATS